MPSISTFVQECSGCCEPCAAIPETLEILFAGVTACAGCRSEPFGSLSYTVDSFSLVGPYTLIKDVDGIWRATGAGSISITYYEENNDCDGANEVLSGDFTIEGNCIVENDSAQLVVTANANLGSVILGAFTGQGSLSEAASNIVSCALVWTNAADGGTAVIAEP